jgi:L-iditol 2-dehydrogenase
MVEVPAPVATAGEALIRPLKLSLCGSDILYYKYLPADHYPMRPGSSGHEMVGIVEKLNGELPGIKEGDMALVIAPEQEAMAEHYVAPLRHILRVPQHLAPEHIVQAQQLGTVIYASKQLPNIVGQDVAVIGQGSAGLWWNFVLHRLGARRVVALDIQQHRLQLSQRYGASHTLHNATRDPVEALKDIFEGKLADVVIEAAGSTGAINLAIKLVQDYGLILQFGVPHEERFEVDYRPMFRKCVTLTSIVYASREANHSSTRQAIDTIAAGIIDVAPVITHHFPFEQVLEAYQLQQSKDQDAVKIVIDMP